MSNNPQQSNGQIQIDPQALINKLMGMIGQLSGQVAQMELALEQVSAERDDLLQITRTQQRVSEVDAIVATGA